MNLSATALVGIGAAVIVFLLLVWTVLTFNRLVRLRTQVRASWAQIDVQLQRRHDLIGNLVETVRGYAAHEHGTLEAVVAARSGAVDARGSGAARQGEAEGVLTAALGRLFALTEAYPTLRASENFAALQGQLAETEDKVAYARQFYNSATQSLNAAIATFPTMVVAGIGGFRAEPYFQVGASERIAPRVSFS